LQLVGMSILLILLSPEPGCHNFTTNVNQNYFSRDHEISVKVTHIICGNGQI